jgi:hypothetical protein
VKIRVAIPAANPPDNATDEICRPIVAPLGCGYAIQGCSPQLLHGKCVPDFADVSEPTLNPAHG